MASGLHPRLLVSDKINYKLWTEDTACFQLLHAPGHLLTQANSVDASTSLAGIKPWYHVCRSRHKASQQTLKQNKPVTPLFHWLWLRTVITTYPEMEQAWDTFVLVRTVITFYRVGDQRTTHYTGLPRFSLVLKHVQTTNERDRQTRDR